MSINLPRALWLLAAFLLASGAPAYAQTTSAAPDWVDSTLTTLDLRDRVAQMVMVWAEGGTPRYGSPEWNRMRELVVDQRVGGLVVGKGSAVGTASWLNQLQRWTEVPLLVAADLEWGPGMRLLGGTTFPMNMALAATGDLRYVYEAGRITGLEARAAGVHMAFAPVADVNVNPRNPVINTRSYGADPATVALNVASFIAGARDGGVITVAKHFPGHGDTETDSHLALPVLAAPLERIEQVELVPFNAAIRSGVDGVMTAHLAVPALDPVLNRPATLSGAILSDLLRDRMGFDGLIVTDALIMDGVRRHASPGEVAVEAVIAGADILLMPPEARVVIDAVVAAVEAGRISRARIDESVRRLLAAKHRVGLDEGALVDMQDLERVLGAPEHRAWSEEVATRSLTLVRAANGALPLPTAEPRPLRIAAVVYDEGRGSTAGDVLADELRQRGALVEVARLSRRSDRSDARAVEAVTAGADVLLFLSFSNAAPWRGQLGLPAPVAEVAERLARRGALVLNFGNPYLLADIPSAETYLLAWSDGESEERATARALVGEAPVTGVLPIPLGGSYRMGSGLTLPVIGLGGPPPAALDVRLLRAVAPLRRLVRHGF